jgi:hypothetical protein
VVDLRHDGEAVALEPLDEPRFPERLAPVELLRHHAAGQALELALVAGQRQARVPEMIVEIEGGVVHPDGMAEDRDRLDALVIARDAVEDDGYEVVDAVEVEAAARAHPRLRLVHAHRADVHVRAPVLDGEKRRIQGGKPFVMRIHEAPSSHYSSGCANRRLLAAPGGCSHAWFATRRPRLARGNPCRFLPDRPGGGVALVAEV